MRSQTSPTRAQATEALEPLLTPLAGEQVLFGLDVDGTLVHHDGSMSEVLRTALRGAAEKNPVVIATGRSLHATLPIVREAGVEHGFAISSNGAVVAEVSPEYENGYAVVHTEAFQPREALATLHEAAPNAHYAVESATGQFFATPGFQDASFGVRAQETPIEELMDTPAVRVVVHVPDLTPEEFSRVVRESGVHGVEYSIGWTAWLDMAAPGISKASGLEFVADRLGADRSRAITIGDGYNDVEMLEWAAVGVAMGQAPSGVKDVADVTTASVYDDGAAIVLERFAR